MIYYQALKDMQVYNPKTCKYTSIVKDELLTAKECERIGLNCSWLQTRASSGWLQKVEVSRKKVYWWFGARYSEEYKIILPIEIVEPPTAQPCIRRD